MAARLAERFWAVMARGTPHLICDVDGTPVTPTEARAIIAARYTIANDVRAQRRARKTTNPNDGGEGPVVTEDRLTRLLPPEAQHLLRSGTRPTSIGPKKEGIYEQSAFESWLRTNGV